MFVLSLVPLLTVFDRVLVGELYLFGNDLTGDVDPSLCRLRERSLSRFEVDCEELFCICCDNCPGDFANGTDANRTSTPVPAPLPTTSSAVMPSSAPSRIGDALLEILEPVVPNVDLLFMPLTAQATAFNFLRSTDGVLTFSDREIRQRYALSVLFVTTRGFFWTDTDNWLSQDLSVCEWQWVECDGEILRALHLGGRNIAGELPPDLSVLKETCESDDEV